MRLFAILLAAILLSSAIGCKSSCDSCTPIEAAFVADQTDFNSWTVDPQVHTNKIDEVIR